MSSSVEISILFLEGVNARLREVAQARHKSDASAQKEQRPTERATRLLRPLLRAGTTVSFLALLAGWFA